MGRTGRWLWAFCALSLIAGPPLSAQRSDGLKVYISADVEGVGGVVSGRQSSATGAQYGGTREQLTKEVNAAVRAAVDAGASDVLVSDSHGTGQNIIPELLHPAARLVRGFPRPLDMMEGLDGSFNAVMFIGYHAGEQSTGGTLAHTMSGSRILSVRLNGVEVSEAGFNAAVAGHFGVPVVMVSGDDAFAVETRELLGDLETAVVKYSLGRYSAETIPPDSAVSRIRVAAAAALARLGEFEPFVLDLPITVDVTFKTASAAEVAAFFPGIERVGAHGIRYVASDMREAAALVIGLMFLRDGS